MKLDRLLESSNSLLLRRVALTLQAELQEDHYLGSIIEHIELHQGSSRPNLYDELITLHMTGPLFELYMDISYLNGSRLNKVNEWAVEVRSNKDLPGDGINLASSTGSATHTPEIWFSAKNLIRLMLEKKPGDTDMARHNYLWFDRISRNLDDGYQLFLKNIITDPSQIMTAQIIGGEQRASGAKRYALEFCHHPQKRFCYKIGPFHHQGLRADDMRTVEDFSDINEYLEGDEE
jgi:hypothetical protein